jgi:membrane-associated phospholipid phosphatase
MNALSHVMKGGTRRTDTGTRAARRDRGSSEDRWAIPVLYARRDGLAERFAGSLGAFHPVAVFLIAMLAGLVAIAALSIGIGFLVTGVLTHIWGVGAADERASVWLAGHRTPDWTNASLIGSIIAGGVVLPIVVGVIAAVCLLLRKWRIAAFVVFALAVESASYRATTLVVHRHRPSVVRLEHLPVNASYPSGHTAASIAVYAGLVLLLTSRITNRAFRVVAWTIAIAIPVFVAMSRMYRGMHHPLDVAGGVLVGIAALIVLVFACRAAGAAAKSPQ